MKTLLRTLDTHGHNLISLVAVRAALPGTREEQDRRILEAWKAGEISVASLEGRSGITDAERSACLRIGGERIGYLMVKG